MKINVTDANGMHTFFAKDIMHVHPADYPSDFIVVLYGGYQIKLCFQGQSIAIMQRNKIEKQINKFMKDKSLEE